MASKLNSFSYRRLPTINKYTYKNNKKLNEVLVEFSNDKLLFEPPSGLTENSQFITNLSAGYGGWSNGPEHVNVVDTIKGSQRYTEYAITSIYIHKSGDIEYINI